MVTRTPERHSRSADRAWLAQSVERGTFNPKVEGSSPSSGGRILTIVFVKVHYHHRRFSCSAFLLFTDLQCFNRDTTRDAPQQLTTIEIISSYVEIKPNWRRPRESKREKEKKSQVSSIMAKTIDNRVGIKKYRPTWGSNPRPWD